MYKINKNSFINPQGVVSKSIVTELINDKVQQEKQMNSLDDYLETHVKENHHPLMKKIMSDFQSFIALHILSNKSDCIVLDVGCGISKKHPLYFNRLTQNSSIVYIGLDPFEENQSKRDYLFINGIFEGLSNSLSTKFDYLIFSTCLDHFEDLDKVKQEIKKVITPNCIVFFWIGVHNTETVAKYRLSYVLFENFKIYNLVHLITKPLLTPFLILYYFIKSLLKKYKMYKKIPLDNLHFHYFTKKSAEDYLKEIGEIIDVKPVRLTNSIFYAVRPK